MPVEDLPAEEYSERAIRFHRDAEELPPAVGERFEAMAKDALAIAGQKTLEAATLSR
jgi:hypothetical protein